MPGKGGISLRLSEPRIKPLEEADWTEVERALLGPIKEERGSVPNIYRTFARHPELFTPRLNFGRHLQRESTLPARDREVLINRIAWLSNAEYEWSAHTRLGRAAGLSEEDIERIAAGPEAQGGRDFDRTLLRATDELFIDTMIGDSTWQALSQSYDTHQMMDLTMTVGGYHMLAMALNSFGVQLQDGASGFPPAGERRAAVPNGRAAMPTRLSEPRIAPISQESWSDEERELLEGLVESRGYIPNVFGTLANHPTMYRLWIDFAGQILRRSSLPGREREMLINRIAWLASGEYEWAAHNPIGRREGLTDVEIAGLSVGPVDEILNPDDRALLQAVDELHQDCFIQTATWESLSGRFDDRQMIDFVLTVGAYKMLAMALNSFGTQLQDGMVGFSGTP